MALPEYLSANASDVREFTFSALFVAEEAKRPFSISDNHNLDYFTIFRFSSHFAIFSLLLFK